MAGAPLCGSLRILDESSRNLDAAKLDYHFMTSEFKNRPIGPELEFWILEMPELCTGTVQGLGRVRIGVSGVGVQGLGFDGLGHMDYLRFPSGFL